MFAVMWFDNAGKEIAKVTAASLEQAKQKIRATVSRRQFPSATKFKLDCTEVDQEDLHAFIKSEMIHSAARSAPTLDP